MINSLVIDYHYFYTDEDDNNKGGGGGGYQCNFGDDVEIIVRRPGKKDEIIYKHKKTPEDLFVKHGYKAEGIKI